MTSDTPGLNNSQPELPIYQAPHVVRMNGLRGGFGVCFNGEGNTTGACQTTGAANTGYDGCIAGTTNSNGGACTAGGTNTTPGTDCTAGTVVDSGACVAGGNYTP